MKFIIMLIFALLINANIKAQEVQVKLDSSTRVLLHDINKLYLYDLFKSYQAPNYLVTAEFMQDKDRFYRRNVLLNSVIRDTLMDSADRDLARKVLVIHKVNLDLLELDKELQDSLFTVMYTSVRASNYIQALEKLKETENKANNLYIAETIKNIQDYEIASVGLQNELDKYEKVIDKVVFDQQIIDEFKKLKTKYNKTSKYPYLNDVIDENIKNKKIVKKVFDSNKDNLTTNQPQLINSNLN